MLLLALLLLLFTPFLMASLRLCCGWHFCGCDNFDIALFLASVSWRFCSRFCCFLVALFVPAFAGISATTGDYAVSVLFLAMLFGVPVYELSVVTQYPS
jgi:hypothetical protein